jgi:hypothetical protein
MATMEAKETCRRRMGVGDGQAWPGAACGSGCGRELPRFSAADGAAPLSSHRFEEKPQQRWPSEYGGRHSPDP